MQTWQSIKLVTTPSWRRNEQARRSGRPFAKTRNNDFELNISSKQEYTKYTHASCTSDDDTQEWKHGSQLNLSPNLVGEETDMRVEVVDLSQRHAEITAN